jgi:hypothetical protein
LDDPSAREKKFTHEQLPAARPSGSLREEPPRGAGPLPEKKEEKEPPKKDELSLLASY